VRIERLEDSLITVQPTADGLRASRRQLERKYLDTGAHVTMLNGKHTGATEVVFGTYPKRRRPSVLLDSQTVMLEANFGHLMATDKHGGQGTVIRRYALHGVARLSDRALQLSKAGRYVWWPRNVYRVPFRRSRSPRDGGIRARRTGLGT